MNDFVLLLITLVASAYIIQFGVVIGLWIDDSTDYVGNYVWNTKKLLTWLIPFYMPMYVFCIRLKNAIKNTRNENKKTGK